MTQSASSTKVRRRALGGALAVLITLGTAACTGSSDAGPHPSTPSHVTKDRPSPTTTSRKHSKKPSVLTFTKVSAKVDKRIEKVVPLLEGVQNVTYYKTSKRLQVYLTKATAQDIAIIRANVKKARTRH